MSALRQVELGVAFTQIDCGSCGGSYAINERYHDHCQERGKSWTCPYCKCGWGYSNKGLLAEEKERHQKTLARLNTEIAEKEALARKLKRVDRGVCPKCNRTFRNLARHMACKHKD